MGQIKKDDIVFDREFFEKCNKLKLQIFRGSDSANRKKKERLINLGVLQPQLSFGRRSGWPGEMNPVERAVRVDRLVKLQGGKRVRWERVRLSINIPDVLFWLKRRDKFGPLAFDKLDEDDIKDRDWGGLYEALEYLASNFELHPNWDAELLAEEVKEEFEFLLRSILFWYLEQEITGMELLSSLKVEMRRVTSRQQDWSRVQKWIEENVGTGSKNSSIYMTSNLLMFEAISERSIKGDKVIDVLSKAFEILELPTLQSLQGSYKDVLERAQRALGTGRFDGPTVAADVLELWKMRNV